MDSQQVFCLLLKGELFGEMVVGNKKASCCWLFYWLKKRMRLDGESEATLVAHSLSSLAQQHNGRVAIRAVVGIAIHPFGAMTLSLLP